MDELSATYPKEEIISLSKLILLETTGLTQTEILLDSQRTIIYSAWDKINKICAQLKENKPIQYILGNTEFYNLRLQVNKHTLIPRQETEELVDLIIKENSRAGLRVIDFGTGSGAIAIALFKHLDSALVIASDISAEALKIAEINSIQNKCRIKFIRDDIFDSSIREEESFDLVVSNPPYIKESEKDQMHRNVLDFEPSSALYVTDNDPLIYYRALGDSACSLLKKGGALYFEINETLGLEIVDMLVNFGFIDVRIIKDINEKDRIVSAKK